MRSRKFHMLVWILTAIAMTMLGCDSTEDPTGVENSIGDLTQLAPPRPDAKVYVTPSTMEYHLALCPNLTADKEVMILSEAIEQGYIPCEYCFPPPEEPKVEMVYIVDNDTHYHLALCRHLDETKSAIPKSEAIEQGYTPCPDCHYGVSEPVESHVYVIEGDEHYHINGCSCLTDDKILKPKAEAIAEGYTPCPECGIRIRLEGEGNKLVYVTKSGKEDGTYHTNRNCKHLDEAWRDGTVEIYILWKFRQEYKEKTGKTAERCKDCDEERHNDEEP